MKNIYMSESYISALTDMYGAAAHKHLMLQLFMNNHGKCHVMVENKIISGGCILVDRNILHSIAEQDKKGFIMLIDPASSIAKQLQEKFLIEKGYFIFHSESIQKELIHFYENPCMENNEKFISLIFNYLDIDYKRKTEYDERIKELLSILESYDVDEYSVSEISERLALSSSRLAHLFKEQTGMPLKSYLQLCRLEKAYRLLMNGKSITDAAILSGFCSSSHMAWQNKKMTGLSTSELLKDSEFLKVKK